MRANRILAIGAATLISLTLLTTSSAFAAPARVSVVGSGPGTSIYVMYGGLAALVSERSKSVQMSNKTTRGAVEDLRLIKAGKADFGLGGRRARSAGPEREKAIQEKTPEPSGHGPRHGLHVSDGRVSEFRRQIH